MKSYLRERQFYIEIQGYNSSVKQLGEKSVIQGSKLASFHYNVYTIEAGKIEEIIKDQNMY